MKAPVRALGLPRPQVGAVARNLALVGGATAIGQGALVLAAPVLARLYDPQAFGLLSVYAAILSVLLAVSSLRFDFAVPIANDPTEAIHLLCLSLVIAIAMTLVVAVVTIVWGSPLSTLLGAAPLAPFLWILPVGLLVASTAQVVTSWATYHRLFPRIGRLRATQGVGQAVCQAGLGIMQVGPIGLIIGDTAGRVVGIEQLVRPLAGALQSTPLSKSAMWQYARGRWAFARVMTAASLLNVLSLQVPFLMIPALFDLQLSGQYFLAYKILVLPTSLVAAAVSQVFFGEASARRQDPARLHALARNTAVSLFVFSIPTYLTVLFAGPVLIQVAFGSQWATAGMYAQIMAPGLILWGVANPISTLLLVGRRERESLAFTAGELAMKVGALMCGVLFHSLTVGLIVLSAATILINIGALWRFLRVAKVGLRDLLRPAGRILAATLPWMVMVIAVGTVTSVGAAAAAPVAWAIAFGLSARLSPEVRSLVSGAHD
jgi:O-antigen/teichoic acid export membrane protein